jgi:thiol-disulfide isomerase/thioredoxin/sugar lactone lactonase YvrE
MYARVRWPLAGVLATYASTLAGLFIVAAFFLFSATAGAADASFPFARRDKLPAWPPNVTWINTAGPIELHDLRGKFVLLDFWTYCCINCMHILPELHKLEQTWPKNLVVIGVHSAKFSTEQQTPNIVAAIQRYKIGHPVINDARHELWDLFNVQGWPTLVLIDPEGNIVSSASGEATFEQIDKVLRGAMAYYRSRHLLDETPLRFDMSAKKTASAATPLRYPGKVLADEKSGRLFIADSNHNRIVVARLDGMLVDVIGNGAAGAKDGDFATAEFNQPQGMALHGEILFVADTENHDIRRIDLAEKTVTTVAGTGKQSHSTVVARRSIPKHTALSSPWDLLVHGDELYIAMAGCHQIWRMKLDGSVIGPYAGNGAEDIVDGTLLPAGGGQVSSSFAQPSGLTSDGSWLYVADSEGSSIRGVSLKSRGDVRTVVGTSRLPTARLFTFGDVDGAAGVARFQHPLGVQYHEGKIYVADTYNSKIRVVNPHDGSVQTLVGTGKAGNDDSPASFFEPAGLTEAGGKLYVADTNNHAIRTIDLKTAQVATLPISGLKAPEPPTPVVKRPPGGEKLPQTAVRVTNGQVRMHVTLDLPTGFELNPVAPLEYLIEAAGPSGPVSRDKVGKPVRLDKPVSEFEIAVPVTVATGRDTIRLSVDYYYCREGAEGICKAGTIAWIVPLELTESGAESVKLRHRAR